MVVSKITLPPLDAPANDSMGNYHFDQQFVHRLKHWLNGIIPMNLHINAIQAAICFQAMKTIKILGQMSVPAQESRLLANYHAIVTEVFDAGIMNNKFKTCFDKMKEAQNNSAINGSQEQLCHQWQPTMAAKSGQSSLQLPRKSTIE